MTSTRVYLGTLAAALSFGATGAFAGAEPASPTPILPPPPPPVPSVVTAPVTLTPQQAQAAQALVQTFASAPPTSISLSLQTRTVTVLRSLLAAPDTLAQLGLTPAQVEALIAQVEAIPVVED